MVGQMETTDASLALADHYLELDRFGDALRALDDARGDALHDPRYWWLRARAELGVGQPWKCIKAAQSGLALDPDDTDLLTVLAFGWLRMGEPDQAEKQLVRTVELEPWSPQRRANLALVLAEMKRFPEAMDMVTSALELDPSSSVALGIRAQIAVMSGHGNADRFVDEALAEDPGDDLAHALRGHLALRDKRFSDAAQAFDAAAHIDPADAAHAANARETRLLMHPLLAPVRPIWRFGRQQSYIVFLALFIGFRAAGLDWIAGICGVIWLVLVVLSRLGPRYLRWREGRKYGGF